MTPEPPSLKNRPFPERVRFASAGLAAGWRRESSFRTHCVFAGLALLALLVLRPAPVWWALVAVTVALVLALELLNAALEGMIDLLHPGHHAEVKAVKDMAAGAVLMISIGALVVALALVIDTVRDWI